MESFIKAPSISHKLHGKPNAHYPGQRAKSGISTGVSDRAAICPPPQVSQCRTAHYTSLGTVQNLRRRRVSQEPDHSRIPFHANVTTGDPELTTDVSRGENRAGHPMARMGTFKSYASVTGDNPDAIVGYSSPDRQKTLPDSVPDTTEVTEPRVYKQPPLAESEPLDEAWWMVILQQSSIGALNNYLKHNHHLLRADAANGQKHNWLFHQVRELLKKNLGKAI